MILRAYICQLKSSGFTNYCTIFILYINFNRSSVSVYERIYPMSNFLKDFYRCILENRQFVTNCCFYSLTITWATMEGEKEKTVCAEKKKACQYFNREAGELKHLEGVTVVTPATLFLSSKHTLHSELCPDNKAKCYNHPPLRNIRCTTRKRCGKKARKGIGMAEKRGKVL